MYNVRYTNFDLSSHKCIQAQIPLKSVILDILQKIDKNEPYYKIFNTCRSQKNVSSYTGLVQEITKNFKDLIIVSMGGATLNPETIISLIDNPNPNNIKIHYLNNTDPYFFESLLDKVDLKHTAILAISNSGNTLETVSLVGIIINEFKKSNINDLKKNFFFITNRNKGVLKDIAAEIGGVVIEHETDISGRYSGLSNVSIVPGLIAGIEMNGYFDGAKNVLKDLELNLENSEVAKSVNFIFSNNLPILVNIGYLQKFLPMLTWYTQITAESLGKEGKGYTPLHGLGPNDQHTTMQLFLDGPRDKIFTLFYAKDASEEHKAFSVDSLQALGHLKNENLYNINAVNFQATVHALTARNLQLRQFVLNDLSAKTIGAIVCHLMLEIIILANMMEINPFDQPGVELIKEHSSNLIKNKF